MQEDKATVAPLIMLETETAHYCLTALVTFFVYWQFQQLRNLDPFLILDEFMVRKPAGFPDHPHRGFETVSASKSVIDFFYPCIAG